MSVKNNRKLIRVFVQQSYDEMNCVSLY